MGERTFVIRECNKNETYGQITESELKRRLEAIVDGINKEVDDFEPCVFTELGTKESIDILLHGEAKEQPVTRAEAIRISNETLAKAEQERKPDVWEAWVQRMPITDIWISRAAVQQWFREMVELIRKEQP